MAFQLKDFVSIVAAMTNRAKATQSQITDFEVGSVARTLMESPAIEIEQLYQRMFAGILDAIPVAIYRSFQFDVLDPVKARGNVLIGFGGPLESAYTVDAGGIFLNRSTGQRYLAVDAVTAPIGATSMTVLVEAERVGSAFNCGPGQITVAVNSRPPIGSTVTNTAILTGNDGETETERMARFGDYILSISRGTAFSVRYGAGTAKVVDGAGETVEYVTRVDLLEQPGYVQLFVYGSDGVPSAALLTAVRLVVDGYYDQVAGKYVEGYRPVGVDVAVQSMSEQSVSVIATVGLQPGYVLADVSGAVADAIEGAILDVHAGETLYVDALRNAALAIPGVASVVVSNNANVLCPANVVFVPGAISVTA